MILSWHSVRKCERVLEPNSHKATRNADSFLVFVRGFRSLVEVESTYWGLDKII